jgi:hypothetical protein
MSTDERRPPFDTPWAIEEHTLTPEDCDSYRKHRKRGKPAAECSALVLQEIEDAIASGHRDRYGRRVIPYDADRAEWLPEEPPPADRWPVPLTREPGDDPDDEPQECDA